MPRPEAIQSHPDPRCRRPHPDALPTHRQCETCPPGADVHPLDAAHFYERRSRFPWNLSRFTSQCRDCHRQASSAGYAENAKARNVRRVARRRIVKSNKVRAAILYTPEQRAISERGTTEQRQRNERLALYKRRSVRARGGYSPQRDGVKLLIRERSTVFRQRRAQQESQRRIEGQAPPKNPRTPWPPSTPEDVPSGQEETTEYRAPASESTGLLARLRAQHADDAAKRQAANLNKDEQ